MLLSATIGGVPSSLESPPGYQLMRPNTPVAPFGAIPSVATYVDPSVAIVHGPHIVIGQNSFVGPFARLAAQTGFIKVGSGSTISDNATVESNPNFKVPTTNVEIGDNVYVGFNATVLGPSTIGAFGLSAVPVSIGAGALIDGATVEPGAMVSALARVGPGVTVPAGMRVLAGVNVTNDAEASNPALGFVVPTTGADASRTASLVTANRFLAAGYTNVYQGNPLTGPMLGVPSYQKVYNGALSAVLGTSNEPGPPLVPFERTQSGPEFPTRRGPTPILLHTFRGRVTGGVVFGESAHRLLRSLGHRTAIRADQGQPITIGSIARAGDNFTVNSPLGGTLAIGENLTVGANVTILGGGGYNSVLGNDINVGSGSVLDRSSIGSGSTIGARSYIDQSTLPAGSSVAPGTIMIANQVVGHIGW